MANNRKQLVTFGTEARGGKLLFVQSISLVPLWSLKSLNNENKIFFIKILFSINFLVQKTSANSISARKNLISICLRIT